MMSQEKSTDSKFPLMTDIVEKVLVDFRE